MVLQLINSKKRIVFVAKKDNLGINIEHESGGGWCNKPEDCFLSAACCWNDNPSCKVDGEYQQPFLDYCKTLKWLNVKL